MVDYIGTGIMFLSYGSLIVLACWLIPKLDKAVFVRYSAVESFLLFFLVSIAILFSNFDWLLSLLGLVDENRPEHFILTMIQTFFDLVAGGVGYLLFKNMRLKYYSDAEPSTLSQQKK